MMLLRSSLFSLSMILSTVVTALGLILMAPLPFVWRARFARGYAAYNVNMLKWLCGIGYEVEGRENIPDGPAIIFCKHQSTWETYALQILFPPQCWVLKRELMWVPFFGWGMAMLRPISIDRSSGRKAVKQITAQGIQRLKDGIWVVIFPEGTRVPPGVHKRWGVGGSLLAAKAGVPVVPVAHNAGEFWGRGSFIKRPGTIRVVIGEPIQTEGLSASEINQRGEAWMDETMARISSVPVTEEYDPAKHRK